MIFVCNKYKARTVYYIDETYREMSQIDVNYRKLKEVDCSPPMSAFTSYQGRINNDLTSNMDLEQKYFAYPKFLIAVPADQI